MGATVLDRDGKEVTPIMGSYGIGIERILTAAIEQAAVTADAREENPKFKGNGFALPANIAPFEVVVTVTNSTDAALAEAGEKAAAALQAAGVDVLLDDRDERAGVKFKDADLIGIPLRLNVGKKLAEGKLELVNRLTGQSVDIAVDEAASAIKNLLN
jgi:prolyl-tRNA synthetase